MPGSWSSLESLVWFCVSGGTAEPWMCIYGQRLRPSLPQHARDLLTKTVAWRRELPHEPPSSHMGEHLPAAAGDLQELDGDH